MTAESRPPLADAHVHYFGQLVAMVVAQTPEQATEAATWIQVAYER